MGRGPPPDLYGKRNPVSEGEVATGTVGKGIADTISLLAGRP